MEDLSGQSVSGDPDPQRSLIAVSGLSLGWHGPSLSGGLPPACNNGPIGSFRHPLFARVYARLSGPMEQEVGPYRQDLVGELTGEILEVGCGNGMNFSHYGPDASVTALEPEPYLRDLAQKATGDSAARIEVLDGNAASLDFADDSFDVVVACLVLCSIGEQDRALGEIARVLRPGGSLVFLEHVRSQSPGKAKFQVAFDRSRVWPTMAGGCHCSCQTIEGMERAGFEIVSKRDVDIGPGWSHTNPHVTGRAALVNG